jgi:hypothetical protein
MWMSSETNANPMRIPTVWFSQSVPSAFKEKWNRIDLQNRPRGKRKRLLRKIDGWCGFHNVSVNRLRGSCERLTLVTYR